MFVSLDAKTNFYQFNKVYFLFTDKIKWQSFTKCRDNNFLGFIVSLLKPHTYAKKSLTYGSEVVCPSRSEEVEIS